jgi:predicted ArsR family transcriptional regulator
MTGSPGKGVSEGSRSDQIEKIGLLSDPVRRSLYFYVRDSAPAAVSRDQAARALEISRRLAAFHLDRLVEAGMLEPIFQRLNDRRGPGAGRPSKLYRSTQLALEVNLPQRRYDLAARIFGTALGLERDQPAGAKLAGAARGAGEALGGNARLGASAKPSKSEINIRLLEVLARLGFEPSQSGRLIRLRSCAFNDLQQAYRLPVCEMSLALQEGILEGLGAHHVAAHLRPEEGFCCVTFEEHARRQGP